MEVKMEFSQWLIIVLFFMWVEQSFQETKELSVGDSQLCSPITKLKVKYESLLVNQGRNLNYHAIAWRAPEICKFEVQSVYPRGGMIAVIQKMNLRRNMTTGDCIDYIQFRTRKGLKSQNHCGYLDARANMNFGLHDAPDSVLPAFFPISYSNSFIDVNGELDVVIYIAKQPLETNERTEFAIVFTSYYDCSKHNYLKNVALQECGDGNQSLKICINRNFFGNGFINCPHFGCPDEAGCLLLAKPDKKMTVGNKVLIGSMSTLAILFAVFILIVWAFKKHKLFCWAEDFANPESNRNTQAWMEADRTGRQPAYPSGYPFETSTPSRNEQNERQDQTGRRLATPTAPHDLTQPTEQDKDLPPSYESLFPGEVPDRENNPR